MPRRFVSIWFRHLNTDWMCRRYPALKDKPFVMAAPEHGRMIVKAVNPVAQLKGVYTGMVVADCRAILPSLLVYDNNPQLAEKLLYALAEWCIRFTPVAAVDLPDGLLLDVSGCSHLWGSEQDYLKSITDKLKGFGYDVRAAMADTIGAAWAIARYGKSKAIIEPGEQLEALLPLPSVALRIETPIAERLEKLGLHQIQNFVKMPRSALRRRFGVSLLTRLDEALGQKIELLQPVRPIEPYEERLPSLEPIRTAAGIEIALTQLLEQLCKRLTKENKGVRSCIFRCYRVDGKVQQVDIGTSRATQNVGHLFKLFELKIQQIEPDLGIELFTLTALKVDDLMAEQEALWDTSPGDNIIAIAELLDRVAGKIGVAAIHRYLPVAHHWPERSIKQAASLEQEKDTEWRTDMPRPVHLLPRPEEITVTVPLPDYPPMLFHYKGQLHKVAKADGPERLEQEWWLQQGLYRDYYCVEDEQGARYWIFRLGHYNSGEPKWFIHGFFA